MRDLYETPADETDAIVKYIKDHYDRLPYPNKSSEFYWMISFV
jgi:hypothetical protein